jgi:hypothetical protein
MNLELDKECFICLDSTPNMVGEHVMHPFIIKQCGCKFTVHPRCWREWMRARNMCPICRRPITIRATPPTAIVVEVEDTEIIQKNSIICMITCIVIVLVITLVFIFGK